MGFFSDFHGTCHFPNELLEQVRRTIAFENECEYCMVKGGRADKNINDEKTILATGFAQIFVIDHKDISDKHFDLLKEQFTDKEISELCTFISFISSSQKLGRVYNLTEEYQENRVTSIEYLSRSI